MNRVLCGAALLISWLTAGSPALAGQVRRYQTEHRLAAGTIDEKLPAMVSAAADIWEGDGEDVLISAVFVIETLHKTRDSEVRWSRRRLITSDIRHFRRTETGYFIEMADSEDLGRSVLILINEGERSLEVYAPEFDILFRDDVPSFRLREADYRPLIRSGLPMAFEDGNRPVPFAEFFRSRSAAFGRALVPGSTVSSVPAAPAPVQLALPLNEAVDGSRLTKKERRWLKKQQKKLDKARGSGSWIEREPPKLKKADPVKTVDPRLQGLDTEIEALLAKEEKPRLSDMIGLMRAVRSRYPDRDLNNNPFESFIWGGSAKVRRAMQDMERVRERLEMVFPGATWYLLGRDVYLLNDALEAVYLAHGETGRVRRLPASQPSFTGASLELVDGFLKSNGINVDELTGAGPAQIILDITSYSDSTYRLSQSRHLMRAAYDRWKKLGREPRDLARRLNFVNVSGLHKHAEPFSREEVDAFLTALSFVPEPAKIMSVTAPSEFLYTDAWHGLYQPFEALSDGKVISRFGAASSRQTKMSMLGELWAIVSHFGPELLDTGVCETDLTGKGKD